MIVPITSFQQLVATCPAPTSVTERHPAPTDRLTEQNNFVSIPRAPIEPLPSTRIRITPFRPPEQLEIAPPNLPNIVPQTVLIVDNHTPLYNANRYKVSQVTATVARLRFTLTSEWCFRSHRNARIMHRSETEGIPMRLPLNMILQHGDLLMLWTASETSFDYLLVTSFVVHDETLLRRRVAILVE